ncbi:VOC family protein [Actinophytocola sp. NPDC049390]|uniref:VOC family protein n=1 Tax=Actinophytocola sp. NPDC049390 TaxID=3363894 RepID=UPI0037A37878
MTTDIHGFHHTGIVTRDLDGLADRFTSFGFSLSPRSRHLLGARPGEPPVYGCTANQCALFGGSYVELLGVVDESAPDPWHTKQMGEGFRLLNFDSHDAETTQARLTATGLPNSGVLELERDVDTEAGTRTVRARAVHLDPDSTPEGYLGIAQHLTRQYVHQRRHLDHPNGACGLGAVLVVAEDDGFDAMVDRYARLLATVPDHRGPTAVLDLPGGEVRIIRASDADEVLPGEPAPAPSYLAAMTILVDDVAYARRIVDDTGTATRSTGTGFFVSAQDTYGAGLFFTTP